MPLIKVLGSDYITLNHRYSKIHWTEISKIIRYTYGFYKIDDPNIVKEALQEIFNYLLDSFEDVIEENREVAFLLFVHKIHESSVFITDDLQNNDGKNIQGLSTQDIKELPAIRRVLKLIMEDLLTDSFKEEISESLYNDSQPNKQNIAALEELIYLGVHTLEIIEFINLATMFKKSVSIKSHRKDQLILLSNSPYHQIFELVKQNMWNYSTRYYHEVNAKLDDVLHKSFCVDLTSFQKSLPSQLGSLIVPKTDFLKNQDLSECSIENAELFYNGLTISNSNKLSLEKSFVKMQDNNRFMYRPIIEFNDKDGNAYWVMGAGKTFESIHAIRTNAVLWGKLPSEWKECDSIKLFEKEMEAHREATMMEKVATILDQYNLIYSRDIKSLMNSAGQGYNISTAGLGQIDLLLLDPKNKKIYVCECKNNRPRFDTYNWKSDYDQFTSTTKRRNYEKQLTNKHDWVSNNKEKIQEHFSYLFKKPFDFSDWTVEGLFILMTPSIYKYDGLFLVLTVEDMPEFIENDFVFTYGTMKFERKDGSLYEIEYPYFKNINKLVEEGIL